MQIKIGRVILSSTQIFQAAIVLLLLGNLLLMFTVLIKIDALLDRNVLGNGGTQNLHRLGSLYHSTGYQDYFSGQIDLLEEKVSQHLAK